MKLDHIVYIYLEESRLKEHDSHHGPISIYRSVIGTVRVSVAATEWAVEFISIL